MSAVPSRLTRDERIRQEVRSLFEEASSYSRHVDTIRRDRESDPDEDERTDVAPAA